jgi:predicted RNase H-like nuclease (RuvC/YqgF family)
MNNEEVTDFQQLVYRIYEALENENQDTIQEIKLSILKESIAREIAGFRNEVNQLRIENRKLSEKIADQAKEIAGLRNELLRQLKIGNLRLLEKMTDDASSNKGGIF